MSARTTPWIVAAVIEAIVILLLAWQLLAEAPAETPAETPADTPAETAPEAPPHDATPQPVDASATGGIDTADARPEQSTTKPAAAAAPPPPMAGCLVHGAARLADGGDLPSWLSLSLKPVGEAKAVAEVRLQRGVDAFAWADVPAGDYELHARGDGIRTTSQPLVVPAGAPDTFVDVVLEPSWFVDVLLTTPDGKPLHEVLTPEVREQLGLSLLAQVQVVALWQPVPDGLPPSDLRRSPFTIARWQSAHGFERGSRELPARFAGTLEMPERRDAFAAALLKEVVLARAPLTAGQQQLELIVDPDRIAAALATVRFVLVDPNGKPLGGASVDISDRQSMGPPGKVEADGRYEQSNLLPGMYPLHIRCEGYTVPPCTITLRPGTVTDLGTLRASPTREVTVRFEGATEGKEPGGSVFPLAGPAHAALAADSMRLYVRNGEAKLRLAEGRYLLRCSGAGGASRVIDTRALGDGPLVVHLEPEATVQIDSTALAAPTRLVISTTDGAAVFDRWVTWTSVWERAMLPGSYRITTTTLGGEVRTQTLEVPAAGAKFSM
ncbi:MAG: carboxypeptidase regulatory-like domain-containing protein [Planctomycetes bacterium]|nr:carboxypeptidase regulatory-like domain-containing protein [Planctomycetota bacterium]